MTGVVVEGKYLAYNQPAKTRGMVPKSAANVMNLRNIRPRW
jgi:hypothetical protein